MGDDGDDAFGTGPAVILIVTTVTIVTLNGESQGDEAAVSVALHIVLNMVLVAELTLTYI